jgi:hypothetical protein
VWRPELGFCVPELGFCAPELGFAELELGFVERGGWMPMARRFGCIPGVARHAVTACPVAEQRSASGLGTNPAVAIAGERAGQDEGACRSDEGEYFGAGARQLIRGGQRVDGCRCG